MAENDQKDKTVEKVTGEVENTDKKENNEDRYEKVCFICHRPESVTGKPGISGLSCSVPEGWTRTCISCTGM